MFSTIYTEAENKDSCRFKAVDCINGCRKYKDTDGNLYCDYSIISDKLKDILRKKIDSVNSQNKITKKDTAEFIGKIAIKDKKLEQIKILENNDSSQTISLNVVSTSKTDKSPTKTTTHKTPYHLLLVSSITILLYLLTYILCKIKLFNKNFHRRIWNSLLLLTFIVSCIFGLFLVVQLEFNFLMTWFGTLIYWHAEIGVAMTIIAIFHIIWHFRLFCEIF